MQAIETTIQLVDVSVAGEDAHDVGVVVYFAPRPHFLLCHKHANLSGRLDELILNKRLAALPPDPKASEEAH